jgi:predicted DNA-binding transcriptional regulator AlpA
MMSEQHPTALLPIPEDSDFLISAAHAPDYIGIQRQTLARWRHEGFGPQWVRMGRRIFYRSSDLRAWVESRIRHNTIVA